MSYEFIFISFFLVVEEKVAWRRGEERKKEGKRGDMEGILDGTETCHS